MCDCKQNIETWINNMDFFVYVAETIGVPVDQVFIYVTPIQNITCW